MSDEVKVDAKEENGSAETESKPKVVDDEKQDLGPPNALEQKIIRQIEVINFVFVYMYLKLTCKPLSREPKEKYYCNFNIRSIHDLKLLSITN